MSATLVADLNDRRLPQSREHQPPPPLGSLHALSAAATVPEWNLVGRGERE